MKAIVIGDVLNTLGYRIRPYEVGRAPPTAAIEACKQIIHDALEHQDERRCVGALQTASRNLLER